MENGVIKKNMSLWSFFIYKNILVWSLNIKSLSQDLFWHLVRYS